MSAFRSCDFVEAWTARMKAAADRYPAVPFDGLTALPDWLAESAREQADRVFLMLDATPVEARDMRMADRILGVAGVAFLEAWSWTMAAFGSEDEPWAKDAADAAAKAYRDRLDELAPSLHAGGAA